MTFKIWRSEGEVAIEVDHARIVLSIDQARELGIALSEPSVNAVRLAERTVRLTEMWKQGISTRKIAAELGYSSPASISAAAKRIGLEARKIYTEKGLMAVRRGMAKTNLARRDKIN